MIQPCSSVHILALVSHCQCATLALSVHLSLSPHPSCHTFREDRELLLIPIFLQSPFWFLVSLPQGLSLFSTFSVHSASPKILNFTFLTPPCHLSHFIPTSPTTFTLSLPASLTGCNEQQKHGETSWGIRHGEVPKSHLGASCRKQGQKR